MDMPSIIDLRSSPEYAQETPEGRRRMERDWAVAANKYGRDLHGDEWKPSFVLDILRENPAPDEPRGSTLRELPGSLAGGAWEGVKAYGRGAMQLPMGVAGAAALAGDQKTAGRVAKWAKGVKEEFYPLDPTLEQQFKQAGPRRMLNPAYLPLAVTEQLPFLAAAFGTGALGGAAGAVTAAGQGFGPVGQAVGATLGATAAATPLEAAVEAGNAVEGAMEQGATPEQAGAAARTVAGKNLLMLGISNAVEYGTGHLAGIVAKGLKGWRAGAVKGGALLVGGVQQAEEELRQDEYQRQEIVNLLGQAAEAKPEWIPRIIEVADDPEKAETAIIAMLLSFGGETAQAVHMQEQKALADAQEQLRQENERAKWSAFIAETIRKSQEPPAKTAQPVDLGGMLAEVQAGREGLAQRAVIQPDVARAQTMQDALAAIEAGQVAPDERAQRQAEVEARLLAMQEQLAALEARQTGQPEVTPNAVPEQGAVGVPVREAPRSGEAVAEGVPEARPEIPAAPQEEPQPAAPVGPAAAIEMPFRRRQGKQMVRRLEGPAEQFRSEMSLTGIKPDKGLAEEFRLSVPPMYLRPTSDVRAFTFDEAWERAKELNLGTELDSLRKYDIIRDLLGGPRNVESPETANQLEARELSVGDSFVNDDGEEEIVVQKNEDGSIETMDGMPRAHRARSVVGSQEFRRPVSAEELAAAKERRADWQNPDDFNSNAPLRPQDLTPENMAFPYGANAPEEQAQPGDEEPSDGMAFNLERPQKQGELFGALDQWAPVKTRLRQLQALPKIEQPTNRGQLVQNAVRTMADHLYEGIAAGKVTLAEAKAKMRGIEQLAEKGMGRAKAPKPAPQSPPLFRKPPPDGELDLGLRVSEVPEGDRARMAARGGVRLSPNTIRGMATQLFPEFMAAGGITVVPTYTALPENLRQAIQRRGYTPDFVRAFYVTDTKTGKQSVYMVADRMHGYKDTRAVLLEEVAAHVGINLWLGKKGANAIYEDVYRNATPEQRQQMKLLAETYELNLKTATGRRTAAAEFVGRVAENAEQYPSLWRRVVAAIRRWLRGKGIVKQYTDNDLRNMVSQGWQQVEGEAKTENAVNRVVAGRVRGANLERGGVTPEESDIRFNLEPTMEQLESGEREEAAPVPARTAARQQAPAGMKVAQKAPPPLPQGEPPAQKPASTFKPTMRKDLGRVAKRVVGEVAASMKAGDAVKKPTKGQLRDGHTLPTEMGLTEDEQRAIKSAITGGRSESMADMTRAEAQAYVRLLKAVMRHEETLFEGPERVLAARAPLDIRKGADAFTDPGLAAAAADMEKQEKAALLPEEPTRKGISGWLKNKVSTERTRSVAKLGEFADTREAIAVFSREIGVPFVRPWKSMLDARQTVSRLAYQRTNGLFEGLVKGKPLAKITSNANVQERIFDYVITGSAPAKLTDMERAIGDRMAAAFRTRRKHVKEVQFVTWTQTGQLPANADQKTMLEGAEEYKKGRAAFDAWVEATDFGVREHYAPTKKEGNAPPLPNFDNYEAWKFGKGYAKTRQTRHPKFDRTSNLFAEFHNYMVRTYSSELVEPYLNTITDLAKKHGANMGLMERMRGPLLGHYPLPDWGDRAIRWHMRRFWPYRFAQSIPVQAVRNLPQGLVMAVPRTFEPTSPAFWQNLPKLVTQMGKFRNDKNVKAFMGDPELRDYFWSYVGEYGEHLRYVTAGEFEGEVAREVPSGMYMAQKLGASQALFDMLPRLANFVYGYKLSMDEIAKYRKGPRTKASALALLRRSGMLMSDLSDVQQYNEWVDEGEDKKASLLAGRLQADLANGRYPTAERGLMFQESGKVAATLSTAFTFPRLMMQRAYFDVYEPMKQVVLHPKTSTAMQWQKAAKGAEAAILYQLMSMGLNAMIQKAFFDSEWEDYGWNTLMYAPGGPFIGWALDALKFVAMDVAQGKAEGERGAQVAARYMDSFVLGSKMLTRAIQVGDAIRAGRTPQGLHNVPVYWNLPSYVLFKYKEWDAKRRGVPPPKSEQKYIAVTDYEMFQRLFFLGGHVHRRMDVLKRWGEWMKAVPGSKAKEDAYEALSEAVRKMPVGESKKLRPKMPETAYGLVEPTLEERADAGLLDREAAE